MKKSLFLILLSIIFGCTKEEGARLNYKTLDLKVGQREQLVLVLPASAEDNSVTWESSDLTVVTIINRDGLIHAMQAGKAVITATTNDGKFTAQCHITVIDDLCIPCYIAKGVCTENGYEFPDISDMNEWGRPNIMQERKAALQIPDACLETLSTKGLLKTCLEYPYLLDMFVFNDYNTGFNALMKQFNGFRELLKRHDLVNVLLEKYYQLTEDVQSVPLLPIEEQGRFSFRHFVVEFMLAQDIVLENLNEEQELKLFLLSFEHKEIKNSYPDIFSDWQIVSTALLYAKTVMRDNAAGDYADEISKLIKTPSGNLYDQNMLKYLDDYIYNKFKQFML